MHRWIAKFLLLVMLVPAFAPVVMASAPQQMSPHCARQTAKPAMQCHHGMAMAPEPQSSEASFRASDNCCPNHDCCRGTRASEWAHPASHLPFASLLVERAHALRGVPLASTLIAGHDSARAPPSC